MDKIRGWCCNNRHNKACNRNARRYCVCWATWKGSNVEKDGTAGVVESTKAASDVYTPVSGEVVDTNQAIVDDPSKINEDPEGSAWFFKLKMKDQSEMDSLMNKEEYDKFAKESTS